MGWEDRPYYRDRSGAMSHPVLAFLTGSAPLFSFRGIHVRVYNLFIVFILAEILFSSREGYGMESRATAMALLFLVVLLHEFGHCFAARWVGGSADRIILSPLGGLASTDPPRRPFPTFLTVAAGPAVNVAICLFAALAIYVLSGHAAPLDPFSPLPPSAIGWRSPAFYFWWLFVMSYILLLFNLLPIYPLDGGQILQTALWPSLGHLRSMQISTMVGMCGSVAMFAFGLLHLNLLFLSLAVCLFWYCWQQRALLRETGGETYSDHSGIDYAASIYGTDAPKRPKGRHLSRRAVRNARRIVQREAAERDMIDRILAKVSSHGLSSLTWFEKRALHKATERQRQQDIELSKFGE
jgi:Zn-dependent protease